MEKTCNKCGQTKPINGFYEHPTFKDGRMKTCKECKIKDQKQRTKNKPAKPVAWFIFD